MPPHRDSMDGPVVAAARQALEAADVNLVLPFVHPDGEAEVRAMFDTVMPVRGLAPGAREVADRLFFETVVRIHRAGEGGPYTGLKSAGLSVGPVIPLAERAVETGSPDEVGTFLTAALRNELKRRLELVNTLKATKDRSTDHARQYVEAMLDFEVYSDQVFRSIVVAGTVAGGNPRSSITGSLRPFCWPRTRPRAGDALTRSHRSGGRSPAAELTPAVALLRARLGLHHVHKRSCWVGEHADAADLRDVVRLLEHGSAKAADVAGDCVHVSHGNVSDPSWRRRAGIVAGGRIHHPGHVLAIAAEEGVGAQRPRVDFVAVPSEQLAIKGAGNLLIGCDEFVPDEGAGFIHLSLPFGCSVPWTGGVRDRSRAGTA